MAGLDADGQEELNFTLAFVSMFKQKIQSDSQDRITVESSTAMDLITSADVAHTHTHLCYNRIVSIPVCVS